MNLILNYDVSCDSAPAGFERVLNHVALIFDETFTPDVRNPMSANDLAVMNAIGWTNGGVIEAAHAHHHV